MESQQAKRSWGTGSAYSALIGQIAQARVPSVLRGPAYRAFARAVGANLDEAELPLDEYPSLGEFFARKLRDGARAIDRSPTAIISPCDGVIAARGTATAGALVQAKGKHYQVGELVADEAYGATLVDGEYVTIYLSPRDYHRVHAPFGARVLGYDYVPGALWPVNPRIAARRERLLSRNERVVIRLQLEAEPGSFRSNLVGAHETRTVACALVMVGAGGVGNMRLGAWAGDIASSDYRLAGEHRSVECDDVHLERGDELGAFNLGSTVVMVFQAHADASVALRGDVGAAVRFGEALGELQRA